MDQAYFALAGLRRYGLTSQADAMLASLFAHGQGLGSPDTTPLSEYYNPLTGERMGAYHFGWTAAHTLLMVLGDWA
jgi:putative isomerase